MLKDLLNSIKAGLDVKSNLLNFKNELKELSGEVCCDISAEYLTFAELLKSEDPKIRQNAAAVLGLINCSEALPYLFEGYIREQTNYNKSAYLKAISAYDYSGFSEELLKLFTELRHKSYTLENKKHAIQEMRELSGLLRPYFSEHLFTGNELVNEFVLLTNRNFKAVTMKELGKIPHKEFTAGVMVKTKQLDYVCSNIRTYSEILFIPDDIRMCSNVPFEAAKELIDGNLVQYIQARVNNPDSPIAFRVDYRTKDEKKKAEFERSTAGEIEFNSKWALINSTSNYEIELRFIDSSNDKLIVLVRFCMLKDNRFAYRKNALSVSMKPYLAALIMRLSEQYFSDNAVVCDPFCGSGAMLIERDRVRSARILYGIDIYGEAVRAASENIALAGLKHKTELVTKDFFEFEHKHLFNEIITDMPFVSNQKSKNDIELIYKRFLAKLSGMLEPKGHAFIYSHNREFMRKYMALTGMKVVAEHEISKVEGAYFYILEK